MHVLSFDFEFEGQSWRILFADRPEHVPHHALREALYDEHQTELRTSSVLLIREPVAHPLPPNHINDEERLALLSRSFRLPVHLIGSRSHQHVISPNLDENSPSPLTLQVQPELLRQLREYELRHFAVQSGALLRADGGLIFRAPSGKFCHSFLRVGTVQKDRTALDAFFFWMVPWLKECVGIITETWTISSIALNASRLMARYDQDFRPHCRVDMLAQYHDGSVALTSNARAALRRVSQPPTGRVLVLISSCMSGRLANQLERTIQESYQDSSRFDIRTLYSLAAGNNVPALCDLSQGLAGASFACHDRPPASEAEKTVVDIDGKAYFPLEVVPQPILISLGRNAEARAAVTFFRNYRGTKLFSTHRDSLDLYGHRTRHRAIYTDISAILDHAVFSDKFVECLNFHHRRPPSLIVHPPHAAARAMALKAQVHFAANDTHVPVGQHPDLSFGSNPTSAELEIQQRLQSMRPEDVLLIIDDVCASGASLTRYAESLRSMHFAGAIAFLVGLARPESIQQWRTIEQQLRYRQASGAPYSVAAVEFLILPDWDERRCPWCAEVQLYTSLLEEHGRLPERLHQRQQGLAQVRSSAGLVNDLYMAGAPDAVMTINDNSIFIEAGATQAEVFSAVAAALQRLRAGVDEYSTPPSRPKLHRVYPVVPYLHPINYQGDRFTEAVIRSSIIRAATVADLEAPTSVEEARRGATFKQNVLRVDEPRHDMTLELLLAAAMGKFPAIQWEPGDFAVLANRPYVDAAEMLRKALYEPI